MLSTLLFLRIRNPLLHGGLIIKILKNVLRSLRRQVRVRSVCDRAWDGRRGNHQRRTILHDLR